MLRRSLALQIQAALEKSPFIYPEDFKVRPSDREKEAATHLQIDYLCDDGQYFVALIPNKKTKNGDYGEMTFPSRVGLTQERLPMTKRRL